MQPFRPGDRVVAINTNTSHPIHDRSGSQAGDFSFPDGPLRRGMVYHVIKTESHADGGQGIYLTGLRVRKFCRIIPWDASRFRKLSSHGSDTTWIRRLSLPPGSNP